MSTSLPSFTQLLERADVIDPTVVEFLAGLVPLLGQGVDLLVD